CVSRTCNGLIRRTSRRNRSEHRSTLGATRSRTRGTKRTGPQCPRNREEAHVAEAATKPGVPDTRMKPHKLDKARRILALDLRGYQIGYFGLEAPNRLLECGVTRFTSQMIGLSRLARIMRRLQPTTLALREVPSSSSRN